VIIPNSVKVLDQLALSGNQLTSVTIPNSVREIGDYAFSNNQLTSVIIPEFVNTIGSEAFRDNDLTSIIIPNSVTDIEGFAFYRNQLGSVVIGNSVTSIGGRAFQDNQLTSVTIPNSVTYIGFRAFEDNEMHDFRLPAQYQGHIYEWRDGTNTYQSGDVITDLTNQYILDERVYFVTYNFDGGSATNSQTYTVADETIVLEVATKEGYTFEGWFTEPEYTNEIKEIVLGSMGDIELFAKFSEVPTTGLFATENVSLSFYPNPAENYIHMDNTFTNIKITNLEGILVKEFERPSDVFNVSDLPVGLYVIQAKGIDGTIYYSTLVRQ